MPTSPPVDRASLRRAACVAELLNHLDHPIRSVVLMALREVDLDADGLLALLPRSSIASLRRHLAILRAAKLVETRRCGYHALHTLTPRGRALVIAAFALQCLEMRLGIEVSQRHTFGHQPWALAR